MEVTKLNFEEVFPKVCKSIDDADFISFDTELTGLGRKGENRHHGLDTPEERYMKMRKDGSDYTMIQFGMSTFKLDLTNNSVQTATYCFYLSGQTDTSYRYDSDSLEFLASNGFNFNKLWLEGLPYLSLKAEEILRNKRKYDSPAPKMQQVKSVDSKTFMVTMTAKLEGLCKDSPDDKLLIPFKSLTSFDRKLLHCNIALRFPSYLIRAVNYNVEIIAFSTVEKKDEYKQKCFEDQLGKKIGFAYVARKIMEAKKPMVGHNPVLDVFQFVDKIVAPLPEMNSQFKGLIKSNMPDIYDTKLIAKDPPFSNKILNSALQNVYDELHATLNDIQLTTAPGCQSYSTSKSEGKAHDAGYDAFMTGISFLAMLKKLQGKNWMKRDPLHMAKLKLYRNKLNLMFSHDIPYLDLEMDEPVPSRSNIFVVECPDSWNETDIKKCFSDLRFYRTYWANDTKVYVVPLDPSSLSLSKVTPKCPRGVSISMYQLPTVSETDVGKSHGVKHFLDDKEESLISMENGKKRMKNEESVKMSQMSLNPATNSVTTPIGEHFEVPNDWGNWMKFCCCCKNRT